MALDELDVDYLVRSGSASGGPVFFWLAQTEPESAARLLSALGRGPDSFRPAWAVGVRSSIQAAAALDEDDRLAVRRCLDSPSFLVREAARRNVLRFTWTNAELAGLAARKSLAARSAAVDIWQALARDASEEDCRARLSPASRRRDRKASEKPADLYRAAAGLAMRGSVGDIDLLNQAKIGASSKVAFSYGLSAVRIALRLGLAERVCALLADPDPSFSEGAICGLNARPDQTVIAALVEQSQRHRDAANESLSRLLTRNDLNLIFESLARSGAAATLLTNALIGAIVRVGTPRHVRELVRTITGCRSPLTLKFLPEVFESFAAQVDLSSRRAC